MDVEKLLIKHDKLIRKTVRNQLGKIRNSPTYSPEDIYQMASIGFLEAYNSYDKTKHTSFTTYAYQMMNWYIINSLRDKATLVKFPRYFNEIWRIATKYNLTNKESDIQKILRKTDDFTYKQIKNAMNWYNFNAPSYLDGGTTENEVLYDTVIGSEIDESTVVVSEYLSTLTSKQRDVVTYLMGGKTQKEIADMMDISQSQVHRIIKSLQNTWTKMYEGCDD